MLLVQRRVPLVAASTVMTTAGASCTGPLCDRMLLFAGRGNGGSGSGGGGGGGCGPAGGWCWWRWRRWRWWRVPTPLVMGHAVWLMGEGLTSSSPARHEYLAASARFTSVHFASAAQALSARQRLSVAGVKHPSVEQVSM